MFGLGRVSWLLSIFNDFYVLKFLFFVCLYRFFSRFVINLILSFLENGNDDNFCYFLKRKNVEYFLKSLMGIYIFLYLIRDRQFLFWVLLGGCVQFLMFCFFYDQFFLFCLVLGVFLLGWFEVLCVCVYCFFFCLVGGGGIVLCYWGVLWMMLWLLEVGWW